MRNTRRGYAHGLAVVTGILAVAVLGTITSQSARREARGVAVAGAGDRPANATRVAPRPQAAPIDQQVLETVLADVVAYTGRDSPVERRGLEIDFSFTAPPCRQTREGVLYRHGEEHWVLLSDAEVRATEEAATDLVRRVDARERVRPFKFTDQRIVVWDDRPRKKGWAPALDPWNRCIQAWAPGYAADRRHAVVRLSIPWSMHSADATYVLAARQGGWDVLVRQFVCYP